MSHKVLIVAKDAPKVHLPNYEIVYCEDAALMQSLALHRPGAIVTVGPNVPRYDLPFDWRKRWIHVKDLKDLTEDGVNLCFFGSLHHALEADHPLITCYTSSFCSGDRILRPLRSLQRQAYTNWEWVIWDDSPESDHGSTMASLLKFADQDPRIRVYKTKHDGHIGTLKRMACGLARGSILLELDHDDDLHPMALAWLSDASKKHPECDFFYSNCIEVFEDNYEARSYGDGFAFGHGSQMNFWHEDQDKKGSWQVHMCVAPPNDKTVTHLVGLPNHFRAWRRSFYWSIGGHADLSVADDYDLLIRSMKSKKPVDVSNWCHIMAPAYIQYFSREGQTFTFKRNGLIQHSVNWLRHLAGLRDMPIHDAPVYMLNDESGLKRGNPIYRPEDVPSVLKIFDSNCSDETILEQLAGPESLCAIEVGPKLGRLAKLVNSLTSKAHVHWWSLSGGPKDAERYAELFYGTKLRTSTFTSSLEILSIT